MQWGCNYQHENTLNGHQLLRYIIMRGTSLPSQQSVPHHVQYEGDDKYGPLFFSFLCFFIPFPLCQCTSQQSVMPQSLFPFTQNILAYVLAREGKKTKKKQERKITNIHRKGREKQGILIVCNSRSYEEMLGHYTITHTELYCATCTYLLTLSWFPGRAALPLPWFSQTSRENCR